MQNIEQLQKALKNFNAESENIEYLYEDAMNKLATANTPSKMHSGNIYWEDKALDDNMFYKIENFLSRRLSNIQELEMPKKLERARNDMIKYSKALHIDEILRGYVASLSANNLTTFKKKSFRIHRGRESYDEFNFNKLMMNCEPTKKIGQHGSFPVFQDIGYFPYFFAAKNPFSSKTNIYISGVKKVEWCHSENFFYKSTFKKIDSYGYGREDEYAEILDLLQGLVEPLNGHEGSLS